MDYKQAYNQLIKTALDDDSGLSAEALKKVKEIHDNVEEQPEESAYQKDKSKRDQKAEIMAIKDSGQRQRAIKENIHLFK